MTFSPGQTSGSMDIYVSSNAADTLSAFNFTLLITPLGSAGVDLTFSTTQSDPWDNPGLSGNYVFAGASFAQSNPPFWSEPFTTNNYNDTIEAGDYSTSGQGFVTVAGSPSGMNSYLATVSFSAVPVSKTETFQVSLVPLNYDPTSPLTYFTDQTGTYNLPYTSVGGLVTLEPQTAAIAPSRRQRSPPSAEHSRSRLMDGSSALG